MKKVSILMNCYNGEKYLKEAVDSIFAQTYIDWEIIFIDNCSTDKSAKMAQEYGKKVRYYKTPKLMSLCEARVFAKDFLDGEFLCILDVDDAWMPTKLEKQIKIMEENLHVGIVYSNTIYFSEHYQDKLAYDSVMPSGDIFKNLLENYFFSFETVMVRKSMMDGHNIYFNEKYNVSSDAEFFIKLAYYTSAYYIDEPLAKWRYGHGSESDRHLCSFPKEYELLLDDLDEMIDDFNVKYSSSVKVLKSKIFNMYGLCFWYKKNLNEAKKHFFKALQIDKKYCVPYLLSYVLSYKQYVNLRRSYKKL